LTIRRTTYPSATVRVSLDSGGTSIQYSISVTEQKGANPIEKLSNCTLQVIDGAVRYAGGSVDTHEDLASLFLEPFFAFEVTKAEAGSKRVGRRVFGNHR